MAYPILTVLFSSGLDSAVLLAKAASQPGVAVQPVYVSTGLAWEAHEQAAARAFAASLPHVRPLVHLGVDMRDVYPATHWAVRGAPPAFNSRDEEVYLEGRNVILLSKAAVYMAQIGSHRVLLGSLACNPFPDATRAFFDAMQQALALGLDHSIEIETPLAAMHKADVIRLGVSLGVRFDLTVSCMQPEGPLHCGRCSKCRERRDAFAAAGLPDPTRYGARNP